ncbi:hypothetical protein HPB52_009345 [Rhipicephalus sanguineus]|uniref:Retrotransposon gag domain-containing protein n=1 Tax=Rhipicephalus sanguineus TaxID=34632 RepID=A0A9D4Q6F3_RHISA|nr:hypothetical protein HPB52_009345 [Rhipicephalus sanguineus]
MGVRGAPWAWWQQWTSGLCAGSVCADGVVVGREWRGIRGFMLRQTNGSAIERERIASELRQALMAAPVVPGGNERRPAFVGPPATQMTEFAASLPAALDGSAKLWHRFAGPFATWDAFVTAFRREFASADEKKRLKEELEARTQHPEENLKEFMLFPSSTTESERRVLRQMHPQLQDLVAGSTFSSLKALADAADGLMERVRRRLQYRPPPPKTNQVARDLAYSAHACLTQWQCPSTPQQSSSAPNAGWTPGSATVIPPGPVAHNSGPICRRTNVPTTSRASTSAGPEPSCLPTMWRRRPHCTQLCE